jgi:hypothetical protein
MDPTKVQACMSRVVFELLKRVCPLGNGLHNTYTPAYHADVVSAYLALVLQNVEAASTAYFDTQLPYNALKPIVECFLPPHCPGFTIPVSFRNSDGLEVKRSQLVVKEGKRRVQNLTIVLRSANASVVNGSREIGSGHYWLEDSRTGVDLCRDAEANINDQLLQETMTPAELEEATRLAIEWEERKVQADEALARQLDQKEKELEEHFQAACALQALEYVAV